MKIQSDIVTWVEENGGEIFYANELESTNDGLLRLLDSPHKASLDANPILVISFKLAQVEELTGIEHLQNLKVLSIGTDFSLDLNPIADLSELNELNLGATIDSQTNGFFGGLVDSKKASNYPSSKASPVDPCFIDVPDLQPLTGCTSLLEFYINQSKVKELSPITKLAQLRNLYLFSPHFSELDSITSLENLRKLSLQSIKFPSLDFLTHLQKLEELELTDTQINDLAPILNLAQLRKLSISTDQDLNLEPIGCLEYLNELSLSVSSVSNLDSLTTLTDLKSFSLVNLERTSFSKFKSAMTGATVLKDSISEDISYIKQVEKSMKWVVELYLAPFRYLGVLNKNKPEYDSLRCEFDFSFMREWQKLEKLELHQLEISDLKALTKLNSLKSIEFSTCCISDYSAVKQMSHLEKFTLTETEIPSQILDELVLSLPNCTIEVY